MPSSVQSKWIWISSSIFGFLAGILKITLFPYPEYNPPDIYLAVSAFFTTALFWWLLINRGDQPTVLRGGIVGAIVGLLTPALIWPLFLLLEMGLSGSRLLEALLWSPIYMLNTLMEIGWFTIPLGAVVGAAISYAQRKVTLKKNTVGPM